MDETEKQEIIDRLATLEQDKANLVSEIKELRSKKEVEIKEVVKEVPVIDESKIEEKAKEIVTQMLNEQSNKDTTNSKAVAEENFKAKFKEFHPDNDPGGIKYAEFQKSLSRINLSGLKTKEEFNEAFEDAYLVMNKKTLKKETYSTELGGDPALGGNFKTVDDAGLSAKELKLISSQGMTKETYLKMKEKRPQYINTLLTYIN